MSSPFVYGGGGGAGGLDETAVQALIDASIAAVVTDADAALDTLGEISDALQDDANVVSGILTTLSGLGTLSTGDDASDVQVSDASFTVLSGTDAQTVFDSVDDYLATLGTAAFRDADQDLETTDTVQFAQVIAGDPGGESTGITISGTTYESSLKVSDLGGTNLAQMILHRHSTTIAPVLVASRSNSDTSSHGTVADTQSLFDLYAVGWDGVDYAFGARMSAVVDGTPGSNDMPTVWRFYTSDDGTQNLTQRMEIGEAGIDIAVDARLESAQPSLVLRETDQASDEKVWRLTADTGQLRFGVRPDSESGQEDFLQIDRTADSVTGVTLRTDDSDRLVISSGGVEADVPFRRNGVGHWTVASAVSSATSVDLSALAGDQLQINGTAAITEFTDLAVGQTVKCLANGAFTLTHSGSILCPGADDIVCAAGDTFELYCYQTDGVKVRYFQRYDGLAVDTEVGTFTPTLTAVVNVDATTAYLSNYMRMGTFVHNDGIMNVDPTSAATNTQVGISLSHASNFTSGLEMAGNAVGFNGTGGNASIVADTTNDRANFSGSPAGDVNASWVFHHGYRIV